MNPNCARCGKIVYPTEKVNCLDKVSPHPGTCLGSAHVRRRREGLGLRHLLPAIEERRRGAGCVLGCGDRPGSASRGDRARRAQPALQGVFPRPGIGRGVAGPGVCAWMQRCRGAVPPPGREGERGRPLPLPRLGAPSRRKRGLGEGAGAGRDGDTKPRLGHPGFRAPRLGRGLSAATVAPGAQCSVRSPARDPLFGTIGGSPWWRGGSGGLANLPNPPPPITSHLPGLSSPARAGRRRGLGSSAWVGR